MTRSQFYKAIRGYKPKMPPHVNFGLPLRADSRFGLRIRAEHLDNGLTLHKECFVEGRQVSEKELTEAVLKAVDDYSEQRSELLRQQKLKLPSVPTAISDSDHVGFEGIAFELVEDPDES